MTTNLIAIDLDNVLAETDSVLRRIIGTISNTTLARNDVTSLEYSSVLVAKGIDVQLALSIEAKALELFHDVECLGVAPVERAKEGILRIRKLGMRPIVVTSRPASCERLTNEWLLRNGFELDSFHLLNKADDARNWMMLVDDSPYHAAHCASAGTPVCLFDSPWNQVVPESTLVRRVRNWDEIVTVCETIAKTAN